MTLKIDTKVEKLGKNTTEHAKQVGNVQFDYKIHGIEGLRANLNLGLDVARGRGNTDTDPSDFGNYNPDSRMPGLNGKFSQYSQDKNMQLLESYLAYAKQLTSDIKFDVQPLRAVVTASASVATT